MTSWAVGVTTIHSRLETYLPETLVSLKAGGFGNPRLFVDGAENCGRFIDHEFSLEATLRRPRIGVYGNWLLGLWELYIRNPTVDRYVMFQDDVKCCKNVRPYLERCRYPIQGYWNLYAYPLDTTTDAYQSQKPPKVYGWYRSPMRGKGALGLVFSREATLSLLSQGYLAQRAMSPGEGRKTNVDGNVCVAMANAGYAEHLHNPSLLFHTGKVSSIPEEKHLYVDAEFLGEGYDALDFLKEKVGANV